jgi:glutaredoxin
LKRRPDRRRKVTLYTKQDCGLCREAEEALMRIQKKIRFDLALVDIETDPAINGRYGDRVPVVAVDGEEVAAAPLDEALLRSILAPLN